MGITAFILVVLALLLAAFAAVSYAIQWYFSIYLARQNGLIGASAATLENSTQAGTALSAAELSKFELEAALSAERERIYSDLHDDVGAKLLDLIYRAESPENAALARSALKDLRDVVSRARGEPASLLEALSEMEAEARTRLGAAEISLNWRQDDDIAERRLDAAQHLHLFRIVREAISNVIRHAQAQVLSVRLAVVAQILRIEIKDDGVGMSANAEGDGRGKSTMRKRADELARHITWRGGTLGGTRVLLSLPLERAPAAKGIA
jgi:signal transduction histidine kinase